MNVRSIFRMQGKRLLSRMEGRFALTAVLLIVTVAFIECCIRFYGFDVKALPSAAYGWTWNMDPLQIQTMRVFAYFLIFIVSASVFADNFLLDINSGVATCIASRCPLSSYLFANALLSFLGGFLIIFVPLVASQLLAFLIFPVTGSFQGHFNTPVYAYEDSGGTLFAQLAANRPYLDNLIYLLYAPLWGGAMAMLSFALSFFIKNRLVILGAPTLIALISWYVVPLVAGSSVVLTHVGYLHPGPQVQHMSVVYFVVAPLMVLLLAAVLMRRGFRSKRDLLL